MRKLALSDEILLSIDKPARYIGGEVNSVMKDPSQVDIRFAMCFPDVYEISMSHLGIQILYDMFNRREDVWCERVFSPWVDLDRVMREKKIPLFALESQDPVKEFDFLGITLQYEMSYTNILQVLDLSGIPLHACDRTEEDPIVIGGGPCAYNPEPLADFFDVFYIGEGETLYDRIFDLYKENKANGGSRREFLEKVAELPGMYVPAFYEVVYREDGTIASFAPVPREGGDHQGAGDGYGHGSLHPQTGGSLHQGDPGPGGFGDYAWLYPRLPFLPGGQRVPAAAGAQSGVSEGLRRADVKEHRP